MSHRRRFHVKNHSHPFPNMSLEEAQRHISQAESLRATGELPNLELSLGHYEKGLESMLLLHRNEADSSKQTEIRAVIEIYMREAEELKDLISGMKSMMNNALPPVPHSSQPPMYPPQHPQHHPLHPPADAHDFTAEARQRRQQQQASVTRLSSPGKAALAPSGSAPSSSAGSSLLNRATTFFSRGNVATTKTPHPTPANHTSSASPVRSSSGSGSSSGGKSTSVSHGAAVTATAAGSHGPGTGTAGARVAAAKLNDYEKQLLSELLDVSAGVKWDDIAGLTFAKQTLQEAVILPNLRPDLFTGMNINPCSILLTTTPLTYDYNAYCFVPRTTVASQRRAIVRPARNRENASRQSSGVRIWFRFLLRHCCKRHQQISRGGRKANESFVFPRTYTATKVNGDFPFF